MLNADKVTLKNIYDKFAKKKPITMITAYDNITGRLASLAGTDIILVGDSLGMIIYGFDSTLPVTLDMIINHAQAVRRSAPNSFVVGDMPYLTYHASAEEAIRNAGGIMQKGGADCVKIEGGRNMAKTIEAVVNATAPVMGHIGFTPQSESQLGGFSSQGGDIASATALIEDAKILEESGACAILVEAVPAEVTEIITQRAGIPVIGLGAGPHCDGQLTLIHGILGLLGPFKPDFVKTYNDLLIPSLQAVNDYVQDVTAKEFPGSEYCYDLEMTEDDLKKLQKKFLS